MESLLGKIVKNKYLKDTYGVINYSSFGYSIHMLMEVENFEVGLGKTIGMSYEEMLQGWDIVDMPEGYKIGRFGCVEKIDDGNIAEVKDIG